MMEKILELGSHHLVMPVMFLFLYCCLTLIHDTLEFFHFFSIENVFWHYIFALFIRVIASSGNVFSLSPPVNMRTCLCTMLMPCSRTLLIILPHNQILQVIYPLPYLFLILDPAKAMQTILQLLFSNFTLWLPLSLSPSPRL